MTPEERKAKYCNCAKVGEPCLYCSIQLWKAKWNETVKAEHPEAVIR